jgi:argininosuccinate synthase
VSGPLILYYDEYHTPLDLIASHLGPDRVCTVLDIWLGRECVGREIQAPQNWPVISVDGREKFCSEYVVKAIKANAAYLDFYYLSAALARPFLATQCAIGLQKAGAHSLIHGFAGNDQLRFEMAMEVLVPKAGIQSVAVLLGSQNTRNEGRYTESSNLWGSSLEAGELGDPSAPSKGMTKGASGRRASHRIGFRRGIPVSLDGEDLRLADLVERLNQISSSVPLRMVDGVEDGAIGLKARAVYCSPAAEVLIAAHRDLELLVSTRHQNRFKPLIDRAWAELIYDGFWFDQQRQSLDAYIDGINRWVTGEVSVSVLPGGVRVDARTSDHSLFNDAEAVHRLGQDLAPGAIRDSGRLLSASMRAGARRDSSSHRREERPWIA